MAGKCKQSKEGMKEIDYIDTLDSQTRRRYLEKISLCGKDPYKIPLSEWGSDVADLPNISYPDIVNYLITEKSAYTLEDLKAYKSLESYNYFVSGWVTEVRQRVDNGHFLVTGRVKHSQRMNATPLQPWIIALSNGTVRAAHCNCMAGLGEVCNHVGALLFAIEATVNIRNSTTVTENKAYWLLPSAMHKIEQKRVQDIDFTSAKTKKKLLDDKIHKCTSTQVEQHTSDTLKKTIKSATHLTTSDDICTFFKEIALSSKKPGILSLVPNYSDDYVPSSLHEKYPAILNDLEDQDCFGMGKEDLLLHCEQIAANISVSKEECIHVEMATKAQANCKEWFRFRAGRITASKLKAVCHTSAEQPSHSLIKSICYPHVNKFTTSATKWGCDHEKVALQRYITEMSHLHDNFEIIDCGLVINPNFPYMGASPDSFVKCDCCGEGCIEIKCPFCVRGDKLVNVSDSKSCLQKIDEGLQLKMTHTYYYQVQCQLFVCEKDFCDFIVWTEKDYHCERIEPNEEFWSSALEKANRFFHQVILLELVGKYYSRPVRNNVLCERSSLSHANIVNHSVSEESSDGIICTCQTVYDSENDSVIGCDNATCSFKWFHFECVKLKRVPKGKWYCSTCRSLPEFKKTVKSKKCVNNS